LVDDKELIVDKVVLINEDPYTTHTNLKLENRLDLDEGGLFLWDIEMTVEEPLSDDEDGVSYCCMGDWNT
jgi:hypothetical protein